MTHPLYAKSGSRPLPQIGTGEGTFVLLMPLGPSSGRMYATIMSFRSHIDRTEPEPSHVKSTQVRSIQITRSSDHVYTYHSHTMIACSSESLFPGACWANWRLWGFLHVRLSRCWPHVSRRCYLGHHRLTNKISWLSWHWSEECSTRRMLTFLF